MNGRSWSPEVRDIGDRIASLSIARAAELHRYLERVHGVRVEASVVTERTRLVDPDPVDEPADGSALICCSQPRGDLVLDL